MTFIIEVDSPLTPLLKENLNLVTLHVILRYGKTDLEKLVNFRHFKVLPECTFQNDTS